MTFSKKINYFLAITPILIFSLGYFTHLSTSTTRSHNLLIFFLISYLLFWLVSFIDYKLLQPLYFRIYWFSLILLITVFLAGKTVLGSSRWLSVGVLTFQPSEIAKFSLVIFTSFYIAKDFTILNNPKKFFKLCVYIVPLLILVLLQPDLGSTIVLLIAFIGVLYMSGLNWLYFFIGACVAGLFSTPLWHMLKTYQQQRILVFLNPTLDTQGKGYNVIQSLISVGSGGLLGKGFGHGTQSQLNFLPIYWTDFIFAAFAEEWGFVGVCLLFVLFGTLFFAIIYCVLKTTDRLGVLLISGAFAVLFSQFFINIGMNMGILPVTGITLPFVSYGGTSMIVSFIFLGLIHSVWIHGKTS